MKPHLQRRTFAAAELVRLPGKAAWCESCQAWFAPVSTADGPCITQRCTGGCGAEQAADVGLAQ